VIGTVKVQMFMLPNYLKIEGPIGDSNGLDVGYLFPNDTAAEDFWNEARRKWVEHVAKRRAALSASGDSNG
jgi:hypothetical protein